MTGAERGGEGTGREGGRSIIHISGPCVLPTGSRRVQLQQRPVSSRQLHAPASQQQQQQQEQQYVSKYCVAGVAITVLRVSIQEVPRAPVDVSFTYSRVLCVRVCCSLISATNQSGLCCFFPLAC